MLRSFSCLILVPLLMLGLLLPSGYAEDDDTSVATSAVEAPALAEGLDDSDMSDGIAADDPGIIAQIIAQIYNGGVPMGFLVALAFVGLGLMIERFSTLTRSRIAPDGLTQKAQELWKNKDYQAVQQLGKKSQSSLGNIIQFLAENRDADYSALNEGASDIAAREIQQQQQRNYWLAVVGTISPLLGLLGTVLGMIAAFQMVAEAGDIGDVSMVADGIYKALATTAAGLIIAIPAMGFFHFLKGRTSALALELEDAGSYLLIQWFGKADKGA